MKGYIHSFETFGTVDGPGVRFVIFVKGCPLRCKYCHNPDTWTMDGSQVFESEEIVSKVKKYRHYYQNGGGVTISGGEPLMQIDFLIELCRKLKEEHFHVAIDTSGYCFSEQDDIKSKYDELIKYVDLFLLDIKHSSNEGHIALTGVTNKNTLAFAHYLSNRGKKMWIRQVQLSGVTIDKKQLVDLKAIISGLDTVEKVELLPYHTMGIVKYQKLGIPYPLEGVEAPTKEEMQFSRETLGLKD